MTNLHPKVYSLSSSRFDFDKGPDDAAFCEWIEVEVAGSEGSKHFGGEVLGLFVCTPEGLRRRLLREPAVWGHKYLFVKQWDRGVVSAAIQNLFAAAAAPDWPSVVTRLSRYFEVDTIDMRPDG